MKKITVIGSSNVDLIIKLDSIPKPGETLTGGVFTQVFGGKGANQAVSAARSAADGIQVGFITCLGDDDYSGKIKESFQNDSIEIKNVFIQQGVSTGTALIMVDSRGTNSIGVAPGANFCLLPTHIDEVADDIASSEYIVLQMEIPLETTEHILDFAAENHKKVILNLAPAIALKEHSLEKIAILVVNETEAAFLSECPVNNHQEVILAADSIRNQGVSTVIITLGDKGSFVTDGTIREFIPSFQVKAVDTTAAGDTYCGALAASLTEGKSLPEAVKFASAAAAISVTRMGAQPSIPVRREIIALLSNEV